MITCPVCRGTGIDLIRAIVGGRMTYTQPCARCDMSGEVLGLADPLGDYGVLTESRLGVVMKNVDWRMHIQTMAAGRLREVEQFKMLLTDEVTREE